jgi:hypothetical protein
MEITSKIYNHFQTLALLFIFVQILYRYLIGKPRVKIVPVATDLQFWMSLWSTILVGKQKDRVHDNCKTWKEEATWQA